MIYLILVISKRISIIFEYRQRLRYFKLRNLYPIHWYQVTIRPSCVRLLGWWTLTSTFWTWIVTWFLSSTTLRALISRFWHRLFIINIDKWFIAAMKLINCRVKLIIDMPNLIRRCSILKVENTLNYWFYHGSYIFLFVTFRTRTFFWVYCFKDYNWIRSLQLVT